MPAPPAKVQMESNEKKMFCATRPVPAPKVHRESKDFFFFALRAPCPRRGFIAKAFFFFCAARPVPALKVHKGKQGNEIRRATHAFFFSLLSGLCLRLRFTRKARKSFLVGTR